MNVFEVLRRKIYRKGYPSADAEEVALMQESPVEKHFVLRLASKDLARLRFGNGQWLFEYTDAYRESVDKGDAEPVIGFPDVSKRYTSDHLWPFFQVRLPGKYIESELGRDHIPEVELLERFGRRTVVNPYEVAVVG